MPYSYKWTVWPKTVLPFLGLHPYRTSKDTFRSETGSWCDVQHGRLIWKGSLDTVTLMPLAIHVVSGYHCSQIACTPHLIFSPFFIWKKQVLRVLSNLLKVKCIQCIAQLSFSPSAWLHCLSVTDNLQSQCTIKYLIDCIWSQESSSPLLSLFCFWKTCRQNKDLSFKKITWSNWILILL